MRISIIQIGTYVLSLYHQHHRHLLQMVAIIITFNMFFYVLLGTQTRTRICTSSIAELSISKLSS